MATAVQVRRGRPGALNGATVDVRAGLKPDDHVILSPPANIADGMRV